MNKKSQAKIKYSLIGLLILVVIFSIYFVSAPGEGWIIDGNTVYIDDNKVFISATPHTIISGGWVVFNFTSKIYTGNVDMVFGFDTDQTRPQAIQLYNPTNETREISYTCDYEFNYTLSPNYFWCYIPANVSNGTSIQMIKEGSFDSGNLTTQTAIWQEDYIDEWKDYSSTFDSINYNYQGMNKWWYHKNIPIVENKEYIFRVKINLLDNSFNEPKRKYWFAIKPSFETISEAIDNGHLYALDPWTAGLNVGLVSYHTLDETSGIYANDSLKVNDLTDVNSPTKNHAGIIGTCYNYSGATNMYSQKTNPTGFLGDTRSGSLWVYLYDADQWDTFLMVSDDSPAMEFRLMFTTTTQLTFGTYGDEETNIHYDFTGAFNNWVHIAYHISPSAMEFWVDGVSVGNSSAGGNSFPDIDQYVIGNYDEQARTRNANGLIDEVGLWNRTLTGAEVGQLYNGGSGITYEDTTPPTYSSAQTNTTRVEEPVLFSILYDDNYALDTSGQYIFSTNNTGTWTNESAVNFTSTPEWANITKVLNNTVNMTVGYRWYAKDNAGYWNNTGVYTLTTVGWSEYLGVDILSYYKLDGLTGDVKDELDNNNGTNDGATRGVAGVINNSFSFVTNDDVELGEFNFTGIDNFTICLWLNSDAEQSKMILSQYASATGGDAILGLHQELNYSLRFLLSNPDDTDTEIFSVSTVSIGTWYFLCGMYDGGTKNMSIWFNGVLEGSKISSFNTASFLSDNPMLLAHLRPGHADYWDGDIDEVGIWNRTLNSSEITQLYNGGDGISYKLIDTTPPTYSSAQTNTTVAGASVNFSILYDDNIVLHPDGGYIFSTNNTGTWVNESLVMWTSTPEWANITTTLNDTVDTIVGYRWYANDSKGNDNNTGIYALTVTAADIANPIASFGTDPVDTYNSSSSSVTFDLKCSDDIEVDTLILYGNWSGSWIANQTNSTPVNDTYWNITVDGISDGKYKWAAWCNDTASKTNFTNTNRTLTIDTIKPVFTDIPANISGTYPSVDVNVDFNASDVNFGGFYINDTSDFTMNYSTGILINNSILAVDNYILNVTINDTSLNINSTIFTVAVSQDSSACSVLFNETSPLTFPTTYKVYTDCTSTSTLTRNGTTISNNSKQNNGVGYWNFSVQRTDTTNYSNTFDDEFFTISASTDSCEVYFNETSPIIFPEIFIVYTNCSSGYTLTRNGTTISNNTAQVNGAGYWNFSVQRTDITNYSNTFDDELFTVNKGTGEVYAYVNNSRANMSIIQNETAWLNGTLNVGSGNIKTYWNNTLIHEGVSPLSNLTNFTTIGINVNFSAIYLGTTNWTGDIETWYVNITADVTPPTLTINSPTNITYSTSSILFNVTATDVISSVDACWYSIDSGTTNNTLSKFSTTDYYNATNSSIPDGSYTALFWCNDTYDNLNNTETILFTIDTTPPVITIIVPSGADVGAMPLNLKITTNEAASCNYSLNSGANVSMIGTTTHTASITISNGYYTIQYFCNDSVGNQGNSTIVTFLVKILLGGGGGGGAAPIEEEEEIKESLISIEIETDKKWYFDIENYIYVKPLDNQREIVKVHEVNFSILSDVEIKNENLSILSSGIYKEELTIPKQDIDEFEVNVTVRQGEIILDKIILIQIKEYTRFEEIRSTFFEKLGIKPIWFWIIVITFIFLVLVAIIIEKTRKR